MFIYGSAEGSLYCALPEWFVFLKEDLVGLYRVNKAGRCTLSSGFCYLFFSIKDVDSESPL